MKFRKPMDAPASISFYFDVLEKPDHKFSEAELLEYSLYRLVCDFLMFNRQHHVIDVDSTKLFRRAVDAACEGLSEGRYADSKAALQEAMKHFEYGNPFRTQLQKLEQKKINKILGQKGGKGNRKLPEKAELLAEMVDLYRIIELQKSPPETQRVILNRVRQEIQTKYSVVSSAISRVVKVQEVKSALKTQTQAT